MTKFEIENEITDRLKSHKGFFRSKDIVWALNLAIKTVRECFDEARKVNCDCLIGVLNNYDDTRLITFEELKTHIKETKEFVNMVKANEYNDLTHRKVYSLSDYCDKRKSTDLIRFDYCPKCGKNIGWKGIKKQ